MIVPSITARCLVITGIALHGERFGRETTARKECRRIAKWASFTSYLQVEESVASLQVAGSRPTLRREPY